MQTSQYPAFLHDYTIPLLEYHRMELAWCKEMRASNPVFYDGEHDAWLLFRYEDAVRVRSDWKTFSSVYFLRRGERTNGGNSIITMDPPQHTKLRSLVTPAFSARTINQMSAQYEAVVDDLLGRVMPTGHMDWVQDLTIPLPVIVISEILGMPREQWRQFKAWTDSMMYRPAERIEASQNFQRYFEQSIEEHRRQPRQDILSHLIAAEVDGQKLSQDDLIGFCFTLFIAGNITTTNTLGSALPLLAAHPEQFARLRQQPELVTSAVEEILRFVPPGRMGVNDLVDGRTAMEDVEIRGQRIRKGSSVLTVPLSNNFDEQHFEDPERFDIARNPNRHLSFGHGIHFCLGAPLARLEMKIALEKMLRRLPDLRMSHDEPIRQVASNVFFGPQSVPATFTPATLG